MTDIANLGIRIDSGDAKAAVDNLDKLTDAGKSAEGAAKRTGDAWSRAAQAIQGDTSQVVTLLKQLNNTQTAALTAMNNYVQSLAKASTASASVATNTTAAASAIGNTTTSTKSASDAIDDYIKKLETLNKSQLSASTSAKLYELATKGASAAQLNSAKSALDVQSAKQSSTAIDQQVQKLQDLVAVQGKSSREAELYRLTQAGASAEQLKAADSALRMGEAYKKASSATQTVINGLKAIALAAAAAVTAGLVIAHNAIEQAGKFKDLADQTGATAEEIAGLQQVSAKSGKSLDDVAAFSVKLTAALSKTDDESKRVGKGLAAIGLSFDDFKKKSPVEQLDAIAVALDKFKDGPGKAAALDAIAKGGAQLIPFLNDLAAAQDRQARLTDAQITVLDEYGKKQDETKDKIVALAQVVLAESIPALTTFTDYLIKSATEAAGLDSTSTKLGSNTGIRDFAQQSAVALVSLVERMETVVDALGTVGRAAQLAGTQARISFEIVNLLNPARGGRGLDGVKQAYTENQEALGKLSQSFQATIDKAKGGESKKLRELFDQQNRVGADPEIARLQARSRAAAEKPTIDTSNLSTDKTPKGKKDTSASQEAKAQLAADLDAIKNAQEKITNENSNAEKIIEAQRAAGLKDEQTYYAEKKRLLELSNAAQQDGMQQEIARLQQEQLTGKDAIENSKKIADAQAKLDKARANGTTAVQVLSIQEESAYNKVKVALLAARQAAEDYFDTVNRGYDREVAAIGGGDKNRSFQTAITQIEQKYQDQRRDLQNQRSQAELQSGGTLTAQAKKSFDDQLAIINEFQQKAVSSYTEYYAKLETKQKDFTLGAQEALANYYDESQNVFKQTQEAVTNSFKGMEDALVDFVTTGKLDFKSLIDSILKDIARIVIKQQITGPLANLLNDALGGKKSGSGDALDSLLSSNNAFGTGSGGSTGSLFSSLLSVFTGSGRAIGGPVSAGGLYPVNEKGTPEVLTTGGRQYLMMGSQGGSVSPSGNGGGGTVIQYLTVGDVPTLSVVRREMARTQQRSAAALQRSRAYGGAE